jgi:hypothetical protein
MLHQGLLGSVAAKVGNYSGFEASCLVKLKTCGFETTKTPRQVKTSVVLILVVRSSRNKQISNPHIRVVSTPHRAQHVILKPHTVNVENRFRGLESESCCFGNHIQISKTT